MKIRNPVYVMVSISEDYVDAVTDDIEIEHKATVRQLVRAISNGIDRQLEESNALSS